MIVTKLMGGLGNQMFQYAFGRRLSIDLKTELKLDVSFLEDKSFKENFTYRDFELDVFKVQATRANENDLQKFKQVRFRKIVHYAISFTPFKPKFQYLREPHFHYFEKALKASKNAYLEGYWQSEKYFASVREQLLLDFSPKENLSDKTKELADKIKNCNAVSLHVRRGDYVSNAHNNSYHGTCGIDYYNEAVALIGKQFPDAYFFVFSDDPDWSKNNLLLNFPVEYVQHNKGKSSYEDMYLMKLCKHNIIANSSFSWWGAWLNQNENKVVIAPKKWFNLQNSNTKDLLPESWIKL